MSVINKMLKDLEQRQDDSEQEQYSAVYQAPDKSRVKYLVIILSCVVIALITTVSVLLLKQHPETPTVSSAVQSTTAEQKIENRPPIKINPLKQKPETTQALSLNGDEETSKTLKNSANKTRQENQIKQEKLKPQKTMVPVVIKPKAPAKVETKVTKAKQKNSTKSNVPAKKAERNNNTATDFSIVKSSKQYSPEQRLELLMKKAQVSFDKGYVSEAIEKLNKVLSISDGHIKARNLLAVAWYGRGELQRAVSILNDGLSKYPSVELWRMTAAKIYFKENNMKGAFSYLDIEPANGTLEFYSMKASVARKLENYPSAESAYFQLTQLQPDVGNWWLGHAISLDSQGKFDQAIVSYKAVLNKGGISNASVTFVQDRIKELEL